MICEQFDPPDLRLAILGVLPKSLVERASHFFGVQSADNLPRHDFLEPIALGEVYKAFQ